MQRTMSWTCGFARPRWRRDPPDRATVVTGRGLAPPAHRAEAAVEDQGPAQRLPLRGGRRVRGGVHGPARRQHRDPGPAHPPAGFPHQRGRRHLGGLDLPPRPGHDGHGRRALRRHGRAEAALSLRVRRLRRRLGPVRSGPQPDRPQRVPGHPGVGGGHAPGQQRGHHLPGRAPPSAWAGPSASRARPRPWDWPSGRASAGCCSGQQAGG